MLEILTTTPSTQPQPLLSTRFAEIDFLSRRGLFLQAHTHIALTIAEAKDLEAFEPLKRLYPLKWELEDSLSALLPSQDRKAEEQHFEEVLDAIAQDLELTRIYKTIHAIRKLPHTQRQFEMEKVLQGLVYIKPSPFLRNQITKSRLEYAAARTLRNHAVSKTAGQNIFELLLKNKKLLADPNARDWFFNSAKNFIAYQVYQRDYKEAETQLQRFALVAKSIGTQEGNDINFKASILYLRLTLALMQKNKVDGIQLINELKDIISEEVHSVKVYLFATSINIALAFCFIYELYEDLLELMKHFMVGNKQYLFPIEVFTPIQMYKLATLLNLQQFDALETEIQVVKSSLQKRGASSEYEQLMLNFFKGVCKNSLPQNIRRLMTALRADLQNLFQDPAYWKFQAAFPAILWMKAYTEQRPMISLFLISD